MPPLAVRRQRSRPLLAIFVGAAAFLASACETPEIDDLLSGDPPEETTVQEDEPVEGPVDNPAMPDPATGMESGDGGEPPDRGDPALPAPPSVPEVPAGAERWSNAATWGGSVPAAGDDVVVPAGRTVVLDATTPALGQIDVEGTLYVARQDLEITAESIVVSGSLIMGTDANPYTNHTTITLTGRPGTDTARAITVGGGSLLLFGAAPEVPWTVLGAQAPAGSTSLTLAEETGWSSGDEVVVAPTDFFTVGSTERSALAAVSGETVGLESALQRDHWGVLQYVTDEGMSLSPDPDFTPPSPRTPTVLDERAEVGNLSRSIVIQGADDQLWSSEGFGAHVMIMGSDSNTWIEGVELRRVGQAGEMGRYPVHFHRLSYQNGVEIPAGGVRVVHRSTIHDSANRCVTIHGTNEVTVAENICYDIAGHAIFFEDAVERGNVITGNLVLGVRFPDPGDRLIDSDQALHQRGSAGLWLTNPDNTIRDNHVADSAGNGFWLAFPQTPLGSHRDVATSPYRTPLGEMSGNVAHSNGTFNVQIDWAPMNDAGETSPLHYQPTSDQQPSNGSNLVRPQFVDMASWKGESIWNRPVGPDFSGWVAADGVGLFFSGAGQDGRISETLAVGESLNNQHTWDEVRSSAPPTAFASYHSLYRIEGNLLVNFPIHPGPEIQSNGGGQETHGGMLQTSDYYATAVDMGTAQIKDNVLINTSPGFRVRKPDAPQSHWTLAGALWDPYGYWGPDGNYWVYDEPYLTSGTDCRPVEPAGENGMSCVGPYYGFTDLRGNGILDDGKFVKALNVRRIDGTGAEIGRWAVPDGRTGNGMLDIMRHAALVKGGRFEINLADEVGGVERPFTPSGDFMFRLRNLTRVGDEVVIGVPFSGGDVRAYVTSGGSPDTQPNDPARITHLRPVSSLAEVQAGKGDVMWHDRSSNRVWMKVRSPGPDRPDADLLTASLNELERGTFVRVYTCGSVGGNANDAAVIACR